MRAGFEEAFRSLTGFSPMKWQRRLFERFVHNDVPATCVIPTGLGKTSVLPLWLLALVRQAEDGHPRLPRRVFYIVNRRTVVDQATGTVEQMRRRLEQPMCPDWQEHAATLQAIAETLRGLCATQGVSLAVSTLRGELADNEEWKADPARPAIIIGTIDMIGSKLLFGGYGDGRYNRAHHAGLVGQDALMVHDEAHLTPAFSDLLGAVLEEQEREARRTRQPDVLRPIRLIELSATSRTHKGNVFELEAEDESDPVVQERLAADKRLYLHRAPEASLVAQIVEGRQVAPERELAGGAPEASLVAQIVKLAKAHEAQKAKILIYVRSPDQAREVAAGLAKSLGAGSCERMALLTGTIRGFERDQLVQKNPVYRAFLNPGCPIDKSVYLVCTSAGEVGIDLDADHLVCDLTTLDALIQRLGRVSRRGGHGRCARVDVVEGPPARDKASEFDQAIAATLDLLQKRWTRASEEGLQVGPGRLRELLGAERAETIEAAFSPRPQVPALTDILLDAWSLSSVQTMPGRPELAPFLHGLTHDPPETFVAWRHEVPRLADARVDKATLDHWFRACPIEARERLRDRTDRIQKALETLLRSHRSQERRFDCSVVLLDERGGARLSRLSEVVENGLPLAHCTLVLPPEAAGLDKNGALAPNVKSSDDGPALDVAEERPAGERRERWLHRRSVDGERLERLITGETFDAFPADLREKERVPLVRPAEGEEEADSLDLVLLVSPGRSALDNPETASGRQTLDEHTEATATRMTAIAEKLGLQRLQAALVTAARWHDRGKDRPVWQRYARNEDGPEPVAKSPRYLHPRALGGYRHELGSLLEAMADAELEACAERDLVLHLIAAHHGWARPHFDPRACDTTRTSSVNDQAVGEAMRRFGRLQERYGRWGLAWLESLLRCADIAASQQAVRQTADRKLPEVEQ
jgi:CRISPR-associated endonuclease/helicase Cas3